MRWIVISLLLINALIFGWRWFGPTESAGNGEPTPVVVEHAIELLPDGSVAPSPLATSSEPVAPAAKANLQADVAIDANPPEVPAASIAPSGAEQSAAEMTATAPESAAAGALLPAAITAVPAAAVTAPMHCGWTPWAAEPPALSAGSELLREEQREAELGRSYLVFVPAKSNREQTLARLAEIKAMGIEAAYLNKGPQAGGISLGLFSKPESMNLRLAQLKQAGVADAVGLERIRTEPQRRQLLRWSGEKTPSSVENQALVSCNEIASTDIGQ